MSVHDPAPRPPAAPGPTEAKAVAALLERILLRRVAPDLAFADVRLRGANLMNLRVQRRADGKLRFTPPCTTDKENRRYPAYALQPGAREQIEAAIGELWARADAAEAGNGT